MQKGIRNGRSASSNQNAIIRGRLGPTQRTIAYEECHIGDAKRCKTLSYRVDQFCMTFNSMHRSGQMTQDSSLITRTSTNLQHPFPASETQRLSHYSNHQRLRNGLPKAQG